MKNKDIKIALIVILAIIIIALVNFMVYAIINKGKDFKLNFSLISFGNNTEKIFEKEYELEELDKIKVNESSSDVLIEKANVDKIKITAYGDKNESIRENVNEKELAIDKEDSKVFIFAMFYWCDEKIIIQVPNDCNEEFDIHTSSGDITVPNLEKNVINLESSSGDIETGTI